MIPERKAHVSIKKKVNKPAGETAYDTAVMDQRRAKLGLTHEEITALTTPIKRLSRPTVAQVLNGDPKCKIGHVLIVLQILGLTFADVVIQKPKHKIKVA